MADDAHAGVVGEEAFEFLRGEVGAVGDGNLARVDGTGKILWQTDTGVDRFTLSQLLPDARFIAFRGTRPPVPDKVKRSASSLSRSRASRELSICSKTRSAAVSRADQAPRSIS